MPLPLLHIRPHSAICKLFAAHCRPFSASSPPPSAAVGSSGGIEEASALVDDGTNQQRRRPHPLVDSFGRHHNYLRISLVEKCNLRCQYCMPEEGIASPTPSSKLLTATEIVRLSRLFAENGMDKVRLTGGEPSIRKDLVPICRMFFTLPPHPSIIFLQGELAKIPGIRQIGMTTNGLILGRLLPELLDAGLTHLNISLDSLIPEKYEQMTRRNGFEKVWRGITLAERMMPKGRVKVNAVLIRGFNDAELAPMVELTRERALDVRFIEFMPFSGNRFEMQKFMPYREMLARLGAYFGEDQIVRLSEGPNETSKAFKVNGFVGQFGFITSMSEHFCGGCNRLRITADGNLKVCLHGQAEISLRDPMRGRFQRRGIVGIDWPSSGKKGGQTRRIGEIGKIGRFPARRTANGPNWRLIMKNAPRPSSSSAYSWPSSSLFGRLLPHHPPPPPSSHLLPPPPPFFASSFPSQICRHFSSSSHKSAPSPAITHLDPKSGDARMVDTGEKGISEQRIALAQAIVQFPAGLLGKMLAAGDNPKGDIFAVSRVAGIMAAKSVAQLIPLCHQIPLTSVQVQFRLDQPNDRILVECHAKTVQARTGVEMEAMVGCTLAALALYDMTKSASLGIQIGQVKLLGKMGGSRDFGRTEFFDPAEEEGKWEENHHQRGENKCEGKE